mmetsp:Transcript_8715/g.18619  ORF Transcript_8715/g.18619 Transcript_8715/m.18619 type:complete len:169 (-) Transcript_8715:1118-1624(-)|eukprot:CAMPEP_0171340846 /NCGR_PEP_ID=MMETSP0878-20121228/8826_1 /TAXON_ID=67004 /ORGANISM="Thalassiosira weissflogii, Strain CCMP1336" /LENGTH=168 /DNA_ID=CAMNT_0011842969 /DNA_START=306 /DNA_END=812 /DNA_ORIENTATION=-
MIFCCDEITAKYAPVEGVLPPGLRRQSQQDVALNPSNRYLVKTAGNALCEAQPSSSDRRVLVTVPDGLLPGQRIHVNFENENNQTMTLAAIIPPNINPGDQFYVTLPWTNDDDKVSLNESIIANDYCDDLHLDVEKQAVQIMHQRNESLVAYEALPLSQSSIPAKEIV